ncbi:MAG: acetoacetate decarboxylase family protein [Chloroflexi bacterium]|nr:acetoacetate decarboxylase family protein [Chloroflexota bacterium]
MNLDQIPLFSDLNADHQAALLAQAETRTLNAGEVLFYEGDPADKLYLLVEGKCLVSHAGKAQAWTPPLIDPAATLGGLPHWIKLEAQTDSTFLCWSIQQLWQQPEFSAAARRWLAVSLHSTQTRLDELEAPVHYAGSTAQPVPGPFMFDNVTLIFAFCDADLDPLRALLPEGLSLFRRTGRKRDSLLLALAKFPDSYPRHDPAARFGYTETTVFIPVRYRHSIGLFVPYIYPSAYEPVVLGREIYGFPKRLGQTTFAAQHIALSVDNTPQLALDWAGLDSSDEPRLVRALMDWIGLEGRSAALAFQMGDMLRRTMRLPPFRRIGVYNHKRVLAVESTVEAPAYALDQLTHAIFGVLRWYQIAQMRDPVLKVMAGPLKDAQITLREAYRAQLDMHLSTGRVIRDYGIKQPGK